MNLPGIEYCYKRFLAQNNGVKRSGIIKAQIIFSNNGRVKEVKIIEDTIQLTGFKNCLKSRIKGYRLDWAGQGSDLTVEVVYSFKK
jgi:hypothetical protein